MLLMLCRPCSLAAALFLAAVALARAQPAESLITAADLTKIKQLGSPSLSPDGKQIVYTVRTIEERPEKLGDYIYRTQLWLCAIDGHAGTRQLTRGEANASLPVWHPRGDRLAFVRTEKDKPQIWVLQLGQGGGEAFPLTKLPQGATNPRWSADGSSLLFTATLSLSEVRQELEKISPGQKLTWADERPGRRFPDTANWSERQARRPEAKVPESKLGGIPAIAANPDGGALQERREWLAKNEAESNPRVTTRLDFLGDGDLEPNEQFTHLYAVKAEEGAAPLPLTPGFVNFDDAEWVNTPAGTQKIVCTGEVGETENPDRIEERDLWTVGMDGHPPTRLLHDDHFAYTNPVVSPNGQTIAFLSDDRSMNGYGQAEVGIIPAGGGAKKILTAKLDRNASKLKWSADGKYIYFTAPNAGGDPLYRVAVSNSAVEKLTPTNEGVRFYDVGADNAILIVSKADNPFELYRSNTSGKEYRLLTTHNSEWLRDKTLSTLEHRDLMLADGQKTDVWFLKPAFFDGGRKYPLVLEVHGGPQAMWGPGEPGVWHEMQFFAARGYGVVFCNPRGSGGYGYGFQHANFQNWASGPAADVLAAADLAAKETWVATDQQLIMGGSYGGYLTAWIIAHDHRFKAAICQRGVYDLSLFFGEGSAWRLIPYQFGGYPWQPEIRKLLDEQSPVNCVTEISTPLLIKQGDNDLRTGVAQSELLYKSLKVLGKPVEYVRYPHATHEMSRTGDPKQRIDRLVRFDEFFERFLATTPAK